jgi:hypothetical protein
VFSGTAFRYAFQYPLFYSRTLCPLAAYRQQMSDQAIFSKPDGCKQHINKPVAALPGQSGSSRKSHRKNNNCFGLLFGLRLFISPLVGQHPGCRAKQKMKKGLSGLDGFKFFKGNQERIVHDISEQCITVAARLAVALKTAMQRFINLHEFFLFAPDFHSGGVSVFKPGKVT